MGASGWLVCTGMGDIGGAGVAATVAMSIFFFFIASTESKLCWGAGVAVGFGCVS